MSELEVQSTTFHELAILVMSCCCCPAIRSCPILARHWVSHTFAVFIHPRTRRATPDIATSIALCACQLRNKFP
jgi:hypothetical protein